MVGNGTCKISVASIIGRVSTAFKAFRDGSRFRDFEGIRGGGAGGMGEETEE